MGTRARLVLLGSRERDVTRQLVIRLCLGCLSAWRLNRNMVPRTRLHATGFFWRKVCVAWGPLFAVFLERGRVTLTGLVTHWGSGFIAFGAQVGQVRW